jgi:hypothetical protein
MLPVIEQRHRDYVISDDPDRLQLAAHYMEWLDPGVSHRPAGK